MHEGFVHRTAIEETASFSRRRHWVSDDHVGELMSHPRFPRLGAELG